MTTEGALKAMTNDEIISFLVDYNKWRRGDCDDIPQPAPKDIGVAIDAAITALRTQQDAGLGLSDEQFAGLDKVMRKASGEWWARGATDLGFEAKLNAYVANAARAYLAGIREGDSNG